MSELVSWLGIIFPAFTLVALSVLLIQATFNLKVSDESRRTLWGIVWVTGLAAAAFWYFLGTRIRL